MNCAYLVMGLWVVEYLCEMRGGKGRPSLSVVEYSDLFVETMFLFDDTRGYQRG